ncbi:hypothetical protein [Streptomyces anandii]|uniref:hypothetical protein n=1 Tax=Streptomyces anandii TaxID=285454 RepID=UPI0016780B7C|nr:hypothetical protein [Streptomyces anandii]GGX97313.1 hypothetical protein GCM10010510_48550 [Streptomyces anandii JCM 4720]
MDRVELVERLRGAGVPDAWYEIAGVHDVVAAPDAHYFLRRESDGGWTVGLRERAVDRDVRRFAAEAEACAYLHARITRTPDPPPGPTQSLEALLADAEEARQQAWQDFEDAGPARHERDNGEGEATS